MPKRTTARSGLYRRPDSPLWWASYTNSSGKRTRRSTGTTDRKEAAALLAKWTLEVRDERHWNKQPTRNYDEMMLAYLDGPGSEKRSDRDLWSARHLTAKLTGLELPALTPSVVTGYIADRRGAGAGPATINRELSLLSAAINWARRALEWDIPNPVLGRKLKEPEGRVRWISHDDAERLIAAAKAEPKAPHLADFIALALNTGCRRGELLGLEWGRVDLQRRLMTLEAHHTKSAKRRSVPLNDQARKAMLSRARFRAQHCPASPWVFCHPDGSRILEVKHSFATACRRASIRDFRIHDLRHTCAAWLVSAGVPLPEIRDLLGHSSISMTERYAHLAPDRVRSAVEQLDLLSRSSHAATSTDAKEIA